MRVEDKGKEMASDENVMRMSDENISMMSSQYCVDVTSSLLFHGSTVSTRSARYEVNCWKQYQRVTLSIRMAGVEQTGDTMRCRYDVKAFQATWQSPSVGRN